MSDETIAPARVPISACGSSVRVEGVNKHGLQARIAAAELVLLKSAENRRCHDEMLLGVPVTIDYGVGFVRRVIGEDLSVELAIETFALEPEDGYLNEAGNFVRFADLRTNELPS